MAIDEKTWTDMRERLMRLTCEQVKRIAKDERIDITSIDTKSSIVAAIVSARRDKANDTEKNSRHPWRYSYKDAKKTLEVRWIVARGL